MLCRTRILIFKWTLFALVAQATYKVHFIINVWWKLQQRHGLQLYQLTVINCVSDKMTFKVLGESELLKALHPHRGYKCTSGPWSSTPLSAIGTNFFSIFTRSMVLSTWERLAWSIWKGTHTWTTCPSAPGAGDHPFQPLAPPFCRMVSSGHMTNLLMLRRSYTLHSSMTWMEEITEESVSFQMKIGDKMKICTCVWERKRNRSAKGVNCIVKSSHTL